MKNNKNCLTGFFDGLGFAMVILALTLGVGQCTKMQYESSTYEEVK